VLTFWRVPRIRKVREIGSSVRDSGQRISRDRHATYIVATFLAGASR
jgi:hypothetical protein